MTLTDAEPAPQLIRRARKKLKLSQPAFAAELGVRRHTIMRWEAGHPVPKIARLLIARMLDERAQA